MPPTSSALSHLLTRGGFPPAHSDTHEPAFTALLEETRDLLTSSDFALVLERALDRSTALLFDGLSQNVFVGEEGESEVRLRTAGVLPGLARWSSLALNAMPNELVDVRAFFHPHPMVLGMLLTRGHRVCQIYTRWRASRQSYTRITGIISGNGRRTSFDQVCSCKLFNTIQLIAFLYTKPESLVATLIGLQSS